MLGGVRLRSLLRVGEERLARVLPDAQLIFLAPPSFEELARRLAGRGTEDPEMIKRRLEHAPEQPASARMRRLGEEHGISYLYITHDLALARAFCDRLVILHQGRVVEEGTAADVLSSELVKAAYLGSEAVEVE